MTAKSTTARAVDVHALPAMLTALRLPSFHRHWTTLAQCADTEGWPASRFLAALAEVELAERETRRIQRHLTESCLPGGKTLATFDFKALPGVPRARIEALAAGDWVETSVLFELIARRYETRSLAIAANQPFSAWDRIFPDKAVTVAAIDRLVHHATILEMNVDSYRRRAAAERATVEIDGAATTTGSLADNHDQSGSDNLAGRTKEDVTI